MLLAPKVRVSNLRPMENNNKLKMGYPCRDVCLNKMLNVLVEELTCLATWKDGNSRYLVGLVSHHHAISNEERYRCFVYEKILSSGNYYYS